jgi:hypothetical protein
MSELVVEDRTNIGCCDAVGGQTLCPVSECAAGTENAGFSIQDAHRSIDKILRCAGIVAS